MLVAETDNLLVVSSDLWMAATLDDCLADKKVAKLVLVMVAPMVVSMDKMTAFQKVAMTDLQRAVSLAGLTAVYLDDH